MLSIGKAMCNSDIKVYITKQYRMFLVNSGNSEIKLEAAELFGFNTGSWQEKLSGAGYILYCEASFCGEGFHVLNVGGYVHHVVLYVPPCAGLAKSSLKDVFPWLLTADSDLVVSISDDRTKSIKTIAGLVCHAAQRMGIMDVSLQDYDMASKTQDKFEFRFQ